MLKTALPYPEMRRSVVPRIAAPAPAASAPVWDFMPRASRLKETGAAVATLALYSTALATLLPLPVFGAMMGASGFFAAQHYWRERTGFYHRQTEALEKSGVFKPIPHKSLLARAFADMRTACGLPETLHFYVAHESYVSAYAARPQSLPGRVWQWFQGKNIKIDPDKNTVPCNYSRVFFIASRSANLIATSQSALINHSLREKKGIVAHELAHIVAKDSTSPRTYADIITKEASGWIYGGAALVLPMLMVSPKLAGAWCLATVASMLANGGMNYASRVMERRTDRNAVYLTRDIAAEEHKIVHTWGDGRYPSLFRTYACTHPLGLDRLDNCRAAFEEAAAYPKLPYKSFVYEDKPSPFARGRKPGVVPWGQSSPS